eukprot:GHVP01052876.1.p1 GENE.GHVP01052876.1~~GHVP01052876.1.p1  ORF type:complete len:308 (+),score=52.86 GHVP01052876.1:277-1200(+)
MLWDLNNLQNVLTIEGRRKDVVIDCHFEPILALEYLESKQLLLASGEDQIIRGWDPRSPPKKASSLFLGHTGAVTGLKQDIFNSVAENTHDFYSVAKDKSLKLWDLRMPKTKDNFFGHTAPILGLDIGGPQRPLTCGEDGTWRYWKCAYDSHLIFQQEDFGVEAVCCIDESLAATGNRSGEVQIWKTNKKKPLTSTLAHDSWVNCLAAPPNSDCVFSGGYDGKVCRWMINFERDNSRLELQETLAVGGCVNAMQVDGKAENLVVLTGRDDKLLSRWESNPEFKKSPECFASSSKGKGWSEDESTESE